MHGRIAPVYNIEPNRRYLSCRLVSIKALVDFINPTTATPDEYVFATVSFLK